MFDRVEITVKGGGGGYGIVSFRREKFVPFGGPDGGDGGKGGDVVVVADPAITNLGIYRYKGLYKAGNGEPGRGKKKHGKGGDDIILAVPVGTVVSYKTQVGDKAIIADLGEVGQRAVVARGGKGGWGNAHFATSTNQAPRITQKGQEGEENSIILELKLIADVGIIGYPNAGKSTLLAAASAAKPKIASYPFTTQEPVLGVVEVGLQNFVLAEIPGLIDGAHLGRGLGHDFLRHIARTKLLVHLVDGVSLSPVEDMRAVNAELRLYDSALAQKRQLVAVNKVDLAEVQRRQPQLEADFAAAGVKVFFISAATKEGVPELMSETLHMLSQITQQEMVGEIPRKVFQPQPRFKKPTVLKEDEIFVVVAPEMERIVSGMGDTGPVVGWQLRQQLHRLGISRALTRAGIKPGDRIRCGKFEWEWE